ncbi:cytochrome b-c1 complex subunit 10 [Glomus cerebriforme]|uniref:Cytochrome b-c1 complex subunit 10 n=1 Tax=Glomus cerebriforme TaxID=658196 RepID=A0A397SRV4_9GLOM|nr:cytochrome b-c1 complex subunit 10 [Glomus cerebriforme]
MPPQFKFQPNFMRLTPERARYWAPSVVGFTGTLGVAALLFTETVPRVRHDILSNIPILGNYWSQANK